MGTHASRRARSPAPLAVRSVTWLLAALVVLPGAAAPALAASAASQGPPGLAPELPIGAGAWGMVQAAGGNLSGEEYFANDSALVYDVSLTIWIQGGTYPSVTLVDVEQYVPGTLTYRTWVPATPQGAPGYWTNESVPYDAESVWVNDTVSVPSLSWISVTVPLPTTPEWSDEYLHVHVGSAVWDLAHRSPTGAALAGDYTEGDVLKFAVLEVVLTIWSLLVVLVTAYLIVRYRVHRAPRSVSDAIWTLACVLLPWGALSYDYVDTSQVLGTFSPYLIPVVFGAALFPWALHFFPDGERCGFIAHGVRNSQTGEHPAFALNVWRWRDEAELCPRTTREMWWVIWGLAHMPRLPSTPVPVSDKQIKVGPRGIAITPEKGLPGRRYKLKGAVALFWFRPESSPTQVLAHLAFREPNPLACDKTCPKDHRHRRARRFRIHIVQPALSGLELSADTAKVVSAFARQTKMFNEVQSHEADRLAVAAHEGELIAARRDGSARALREVKGALLGSTQPRTEQDLAEEVERPRRATEARSEAPAG
ncbi:MAG: hypothetical protein KGI98_14590 [Euryarchaeota archaeon]|nr:hypothetical protein [Euryarchaeota archaeon]MDE1881173.1 hypothetical protein [Euryarchaeota archaeon]